MNPNQIFEDFDRKYQGSFIQVGIKDKAPELFRLHRIVTGTKFPVLELQSDRLGTVLLNYNTAARILFRIPPTGFIQHGKTALFFSRRPERQWKRGIHQNNCSFQDPTMQFRLRLGESNEPCFTKIREAFNPTYKTLKEAIDLISKGYSSVALSRNKIGRAHV